MRGRGWAWGWAGAGIVLAAAIGAALFLLLRPQKSPAPVVFVHGMGASAAEMGTPGGQFAGLLPRIADEMPSPEACTEASQPRPWEGSPCVFRYVDDVAEGGDSQSGVEDNATKLGVEVEAVAEAAARPVVLLGYSMGGTIIRAYLALHPEEASRDVAGVVLVDPVTSGSWAYDLDLTRQDPGSVTDRLLDAIARGATEVFDIDAGRPAFTDLRPRSGLLRRIAPLPLPEDIRYVTFYGDIDLRVDAGVEVELVEVGDVVLLLGDPDPAVLPSDGGQRFRPPVTGDGRSIEVAHRASLALGPGDVLRLGTACLISPEPAACAEVVGAMLDIPNVHWRIPFELDQIIVEAPELGGPLSLEDAILEAVRTSG